MRGGMGVVKRLGARLWRSVALYRVGACELEIGGRADETTGKRFRIMAGMTNEIPSRLPPVEDASRVSDRSGARAVPTRTWFGVVGVSVAAGVAVAALWVVAVATAPERDAMRAYTRLIASANRGDLGEAERVCSTRYLAGHRLVLAAEGGIVGLPRGIHKNFRTWRSGENIWICPTNREGVVYQMAREAGEWRFDGMVGILRGGKVIDVGAIQVAD